MILNPWSTIKKRFTVKNAKVIRNKALAGAELVAAGTALTGRAMLLEEAVTPKRTPIPGHNNMYATDNGASLFKVETLSGQEDEITISEIIGYVILICLMILLFVMFARAIIKIKQTCSQDTSIFNLSILGKKYENGQERTTPKPDPLEHATPSQSTETSDQALEEAMKKAQENFAALSSIKDSCKIK